MRKRESGSTRDGSNSMDARSSRSRVSAGPRTFTRTTWLNACRHMGKASTRANHFDPNIASARRTEQARWIIEQATPLFEGPGAAFSGYIGSCVDITESKQLQAEREETLKAERAARDEAERVGRLKDEFLATVSHELRTPLNAILGWATLLRRLQPGSEDHARGLETIERNARVQGQIIADLLDMSRIISGKVQLDVQAIDIGEVINAALDAVRLSVEAKKLRLRVTLDARAGRLRGDPGRLQQVFWNLLTNAVKFTPSGGRIDVVMERVNSHVEVSVEDSGMGIKPEFLAFVFDRFRQARFIDHSPTRRPWPGPVDRETPRGAPWRFGAGEESRRRDGLDLHRRTADFGHTFGGHPGRAARLQRCRREHHRAAQPAGVRALVVDDQLDARHPHLPAHRRIRGPMHVGRERRRCAEDPRAKRM